MNTHGYEFTLSTRNIVTKDFTWTTDFIFANAKTKSQNWIRKPV